MTNPKVSVIITCYNHAGTVERAINSVLSQQVDFPVELIIIDDGSSDNSAQVIESALGKYLKTTGGKRLFSTFAIYHVKNEGLMDTYRRAMLLAEGDYISFCDGDDFWLALDKLQRQCKFMDENQDVGLCTTGVIIDNGKRFWNVCLPVEELQKRLTFDNLLRGNAFIYAQTYMLRRATFEKFIDFNKFIRLGFHVWDYPIVLELIRHTKFAYLDFISAVWNKGEETKTQTQDRMKRFKYIWGNFKIRMYYILKYGCKPSTLAYSLYRFTRDVLSVILKRWNLAKTIILIAYLMLAILIIRMI